MITVSVWHNVATDAQGRHTGMLDGYQPGNPMVRVFAYQADPAGRSPEAIAEEAFDICNGHPSDAGGEDLSRRYYRARAAVAVRRRTSWPSAKSRSPSDAPAGPSSAAA